jgi:ubiquinone/menaquinone biosynthesis C-methylase UbiE
LTAPAQSGSLDSQAYGEYLRTVAGRLRIDLAWENLRSCLANLSDAPALDVGGGTGEMAVRLAQHGYRVTVLDASESMLAEVERAATEAKIRQRITLVHGDAGRLSQLFPPASFALILCHNLLEFVDSPIEILRAVRSLVAPRSDSLISIVVRNRAGEVLSAALKNGDLGAARTNLTAPKVRSKLVDQPLLLFTPRELRQMLENAKLNVVKEFGIRVFSDYLPEQFINESANYEPVLNLEQTLGSQPEFAAVARYTQMIARPLPESSAAQRPSA